MDLGKFYILKDFKPMAVDLFTWAKWIEKINNKRIAHTDVGPVSISTVFLGIDHRFGEGPPLLFESMIFGGPANHEMARYSTFKEAEEGHERMVEAVRFHEIVKGVEIESI